jgi:tetratricopeptide (TPR) repeat protein
MTNRTTQQHPGSLLLPIACCLLTASCVTPTPKYSGIESEVSFDDELKDDVALLDRKIARGERAEFEAQAKARLKVAPKDPKRIVLWAMAIEDDTEAEKQLSAVLKEDPNIYFAYIGLGRIYERWGTRDRAEISYEKAIALNPRIEAGQLGLARVYKDQKRHQKAIELYGKILDDHPRSYQAYYGQGVLALEQGRKADARAAFEKAISLYPDFFDAYLATAKLDEAEGRLPDAKSALLKAVALQPKSSEPILLLARVNERLGLTAEAKLAYDRLATLLGDKAGKDESLTREMSLTAARDAMAREEWDAALTAIEAAISSAPKDALLYRVQAEIFLGKEDYAKSLAAYENALLLAPSDEAVKSGRGALLTRLGAKDGPITGKTVPDVVKEITGLAQGCYKTAARQFPSLAGKMALKIQIQEDGTAGKITTGSDTLKSGEVYGCVEWGIRRAKFPEGKAQSIEVALDFK